MTAGSAGEGLDPVRAYYATGAERTRLAEGYGPLERERTREVLLRHLPPPPAVVADVGGGAGVHAIWLAGRGYEVHLRDLSAELLAFARRDAERAGVRLASVAVCDARDLDLASERADAVLLLGPLYHLQARAGRAEALAEARRVLRHGGLAAVAAISRAAPVLDGLRLGLLEQEDHVRALDEVARSGRFDPPAVSGFTRAYFHTPPQLREEIADAGFEVVGVVGLEGIGWALCDLAERWADARRREAVLEAARRVEADASVIGASPHLLGLARRPAER
ncbi:MAG TPA: class I SAM-dependent methyltransferase [Solirubrobacteraceae bacterium]|nr:class I SAM-dependent methyltransferase [Solirubrobacteraceae bacterium]